MAASTVREALLQKCLPRNECCWAGERMTMLDCQGEQGRAGNNRHLQKKTKNKKMLEGFAYQGAVSSLCLGRRARC